MRVAFGEYQLDTRTRTLEREGRRISVQSKAFDLLAYLIERRDQVVSSDDLLDALWPGLHVTPAALSTAVQKARQAVGDDGEHQAVLQTEHGRGFRFVAEVTDLSPPESVGSGSTGVAQMPLIAELKRRNVFRVGVAYGIVAWLLVEMASVVLPALHLPDWTLTLLVFLVVAGFPLALILAWAFELTPEGVKRETAVDPAESITQQTGRKLDFAIIGLLALAVIFLVFDNYVLEGERVPTAEPVAREKSIAVLPLANMSGDPEQEFFSDGISEALLNVLAGVKGLRVTSRTSAFAFKDKNLPIPELAAVLGVEHVLEGSFQRTGNRIRISAQLIDVKTDSHLWSASYNRELTDIFAVQDEIAAKVGEALEVALLRADSSPIQPSSETSIDVYSDYLLARQKRDDGTFKNLTEAERLLNSVIERDPDYAPAYAALAGTYEYMALTGRFSLSEASARMMPLVEQALSLDGDLAEAWQHLAYVHQSNGDFEEARAAAAKALELDPQNTVVLSKQIRRSVWTHEPERALVYADELLRVDPLSPEALGMIGALYLRLGRLDDAERIIVRLRSIDPHHNDYQIFAWNLARIGGDLVTAMSVMRDTILFDTDDPENFSLIAMHYFDLGDVAAAESWNEAALRLDSEASHPMAMAALLHLYRDEDTEAVAIARKLARQGADNRWGAGGIALRILAASDLAAGNYEGIIARTLTHYPELADARFRSERLGYMTPIGEALMVTLDLASAYLHAGQEAEAESLLSLIEFELPHWATASLWGHGIADAELHALRGEKAKALAALQKHAETGLIDQWRWQLLYSPNLESIRDTPEYQAMVAEIEADMATQLARVREMERNGELDPIPEISATIQ